MDKDNFILVLKKRLRDYYNELEPIEKKIEGLRNEENRIMECIVQVRNLMAIENSRLNTTPMATVSPSASATPSAAEDKMTSMNLREACRLIIRENKRIHADKLMETLMKGGFQFGSKKPRRMIMASLLKDTFVKRTEGRIYIWQGDDENKEH